MCIEMNEGIVCESNLDHPRLHTAQHARPREVEKDNNEILSWEVEEETS
jgi:hypothetical protein